MKKLVVFFFLAGCAGISSHPQRDPDFVSKRATEAEVQFQHWVELESAKRPSRSDAMEQVEQQVLHLFGPLERANSSAVPKEDHTISINSIEPMGDQKYKIAYSYVGTMVVEKGPRKYLDLILPTNPDTIYERSLTKGKVLCSDSHYPDEGDFWYFWSPTAYSADCPLNKGEDYHVVSASIQREKNDHISYPEYHRLANENGEIVFWVLFGMDDPSLNHDPMKSKDITAASYRGFRNGLIFQGFEPQQISEKEKGRWIPNSDSEFTLEQFSKVSGNQRLVVNLFFGESGINEKSQAFHYAYRTGIRDASILIYDGHSGLGGHLDLQEIAKLRGFRFQFPKEKYQIFFFNSCTSYTYYNARYLQRKEKRGRNPMATKNLDLLVNGLATYFDEAQESNLALVKAVDLWSKSKKWTSYQTLAKRIDSDNLFSVIGDEDNPNTPQK